MHSRCVCRARRSCSLLQQWCKHMLCGSPIKLCTDLGMDMARMNSTSLCPLFHSDTFTASSLFTSLWNLLMAWSSLKAIRWKSCSQQRTCKWSDARTTGPAGPRWLGPAYGGSVNMRCVHIHQLHREKEGPATQGEGGPSYTG